MATLPADIGLGAAPRPLVDLATGATVPLPSVFTAFFC